MPEVGDMVWVITLKYTPYYLIGWGWENSEDFCGEYSDLTVDLKDAMLFPTWAKARMELNTMTGLAYEEWTIEFKALKD